MFRQRELRRRQVLWENSNIFARYRFFDSREPGDVPPEYQAAVDKTLQLVEEPGTLALLGGRGVGKTAMAHGLVREFCRAGLSAYFTCAVDIYTSIKATWARRGRDEEREVDVLARLRQVDLLVVDELQERAESPWEGVVLTNLINARYSDQKATLLIANQTPDTFLASIGESIASRLTEDGAILLCRWASLRDNGKAARVPQPIRDTATGRFEFPPLMAGATPTRLAVRTTINGSL